MCGVDQSLHAVGGCLLEGERHTLPHGTHTSLAPAGTQALPAHFAVIPRNAAAFEYLEEFPMQMLAQLEAITGRKARHGLFVVNMEYGRNFSGPDKDVFFYDRSVGHTEDAWQSNFLHPVIYYYRHLPTGKLVPASPERALSRARHPSDFTVYQVVT